MKRVWTSLLATLFLFASVISLVGCDVFDTSDDGGDEEFPKIDNAVDLNEYTPTQDDDNEYIEGETYYTSTALDLVTEINGNYTVDRPFTLDQENENKRIYRNIYFYVGDFFQVIYYKNVKDLGSLYAVMSDESDEEYAEIEYTSKGSPLQINIKEQGIYDLILDIETFGIDMVRVGDIETPVYETIKSCELYIHVSLNNYSYTPMVLDKATNEYYIQAEIPVKASLGFYNASHMGRYKMTIDSTLNHTLAWWDFVSPNSLRVHVGGTYKVYFNAKTYVARLELQNPDTASYYCQVGWNEGNELTAVSSATPYLFEYEFVADESYEELPDFYPALGMPYALSVVDEDGFVDDTFLTEAGAYKLTVNLKEFTLTVKKTESGAGV